MPRASMLRPSLLVALAATFAKSMAAWVTGCAGAGAYAQERGGFGLLIRGFGKGESGQKEWKGGYSEEEERPREQESQSVREGI